jgi:hypothetical protein
MLLDPDLHTSLTQHGHAGEQQADQVHGVLPVQLASISEVLL